MLAVSFGSQCRISRWASYRETPACASRVANVWRNELKSATAPSTIYSIPAAFKSGFILLYWCCRLYLKIRVRIIEPHRPEGNSLLILTSWWILSLIGWYEQYNKENNWSGCLFVIQYLSRLEAFDSLAVADEVNIGTRRGHHPGAKKESRVRRFIINNILPGNRKTILRIVH